MIIKAIEDICFNRDKVPKSLKSLEIYNSALLNLGILVNKLSKDGQIKRANEIVEKIHTQLGLHGK